MPVLIGRQLMQIWTVYMQPWTSFGGFTKSWVPFVMHNFTMYTMMLRVMGNFAVQVDLRLDRDTYNAILLVLKVLLETKGLLDILRQGSRNTFFCTHEAQGRLTLWSKS